MLSWRELPVVHAKEGRSVALEIKDEALARNIDVTDLVTLYSGSCETKTPDAASSDAAFNSELEKKAKALSGQSVEPKVNSRIELARDVEIVSVRNSGAKTFATFEVFPSQTKVWNHLSCTLFFEHQGTNKIHQ
jgi:hypothetical protein